MSLRDLADQFQYAKTQAEDDGVAMIADALADFVIELQSQIDNINAQLAVIAAKDR